MGRHIQLDASGDRESDWVQLDKKLNLPYGHLASMSHRVKQTKLFFATPPHIAGAGVP